MRALFRIAFAATGIAFCGLVGFYGYHRFGEIPPLPSPPRSQMDSTEGPSGNASYAALVYHKTLSKAERQHVLEGQFTLVYSTQTMPAQIKHAFAEITSEQTFALANVGEKYQITDVIDQPGLPFRRLIFAGVNGNKWLIHYEHGGIGHSTAVLLLELDAENKVRFVWGGAGSEIAGNMSALRAAVGAGHFSDRGTFYW
jgi:hypothetical protein